MEWLHRFIDHIEGRGGWHGFALVEVLAVAAVVGILAGTGTLTIVGMVVQPREQSCHQGPTATHAAIVANGPRTTYIPRGAFP